MSRPTGALEQKDWFAPSYRHACNVYEQSSPPPIASPIFPVAQGYNFHLAENEDRFKRLFPFHQKIRGDGACYFNSCITGILNQCVGNSELWKTVRKNLIDNGFINIAEAIGDENSTLTRQHVNSLLQVKGDNNIVRQLSEAVLPPQHQLFIENRQGQIRDIKDQIRILSAELQNLQTIITDPEDKNIKILQTQIQNQQAAIVKAEEDIKLYSTAKLANTYLESDVLPIISNLCGIPSENIVTLSSDIFPMLDDTSLSNQNKIYLWNPGGGAHFDLLYSNADTALAKEAEPLIKQAQKNIPPNPSDTEIEELKKLAIAQIEPYLSGHITKFKQLLKDIYQDGNNLDADKSRLIIELIEEDKKINTPPATRHDLRSININSVEKPLSTEDKISIATFALNSALKTIADNDDLERSDESDFIQSIKIFLELSKDPEVNLENRGFLMHAALRGKSNFIKPIFDAGEDFSKKDTIFMENTALMWAVANANNQFAYDLLLFSEKDPAANIAINYVSTHYTTTALHLAAAKGYTDKDSNGKDITVANHLLVEKMINLGANPNIQSEHGTPLDIAVARRDIEMIQAICSSKQIQLETIINAQQALKLTYQEATKKITSASQICKSIDKRSFEDQKIKGQIQEILDQTAQKIKPLNIEDINSNSNRKPTPTQHFIRKLEARLKTLKEGDLFTVELDMDGCFLNGRSPYGIDLKNPVNKELFDALKSIKEIAETKKAIFQVSICSTAGLKKFIDPNNPSADTTATRKKIFSKLHELNAEKQIHTDSTGAKTITTIYHDIIQTSYDGIDQIVTLWRKDSDDATNIEFKRNEGNVPNLFDSWNIDLRKNGELCKINALDFTLKLRIAAQEIKKLESHKTKPLKQIQRELISGVIPWNSDINDIVTSVGSDAAKNETESKNTIFVDNDPQYHEDIQPTSTATAFKRKTHLQHVINLCPRSTLVTQKDTLMTAVSSEDINKEFFKDDSDTKESSESIKAYKKHTQSIKYKGCNQFYHPHTRIKKSFPPNSTIGFANRITLNKELQTLLTNIRKKTA
ncbi:MAG: ankyrin repeat domain-containing protein, partial [Rickettsiales bacterium]|nr:ankyrin repeat domain-containing protein [Rickettsiales bacterium]